MTVVSFQVPVGAKSFWLRRTYELYEYWCFFRVAECLTRVWPDACWQGNVAAADGGLCLDLPDGCHLDGRGSDRCGFA